MNNIDNTISTDIMELIKDGFIYMDEKELPITCAIATGRHSALVMDPFGEWISISTDYRSDLREANKSEFQWYFSRTSRAGKYLLTLSEDEFSLVIARLIEGDLSVIPEHQEGLDKIMMTIHDLENNRSEVIEFEIRPDQNEFNEWAAYEMSRYTHDLWLIKQIVRVSSSGEITFLPEQEAQRFIWSLIAPEFTRQYKKAIEEGRI